MESRVTLPMTPPDAPLRLRLDTEALVSNWRALDRLSGAARAGAAVKADGYGLGATRVVSALSGAGCADFFVAHSCEAAPLLSLAPPAAISVLHGPQSEADAAFIRSAGIKPTINSPEQAQRWIAVGGGPCDVMVDTGINRLGLPMGDLGSELLRQLDVDVLMSHLASAEADAPLNAEQLVRWKDACAALPHRRASMANSAGIMLGPDYHGDQTRPGIALYGGVPCAALAGEIKQVAYPEVAIMQVREVAAGDGIGYNSTFVAERAMKVGVIALGYADGYLRNWSSKGAMLAGDARLPVLGRVSMDMTVIDLSVAPQLREGDWVTADYALPEASALCGLSQYELLTSLGRRFVR